MTPAGLQAFRARMGWNRSRLSAELGADRKTVARWLAGAVPIPLYVAHACSSLEAGLAPMGDEPAERIEP